MARYIEKDLTWLGMLICGASSVFTLNMIALVVDLI